MARWNDRGKTRRIGRKRLAERSAIQHDASRAPPRRARLGTYFSQSDSPHDRPLGGWGGPDAAVAPRARAASRRGGHDGVSLHGGAGNHILCHRGRHRSPRSLRSYPSAPRIAWWDSGPRLDAMAQTLAREFSLVERDGGRSGQSPVAVDGAGVDYVRRSTNEGAWSTSHLSVDGRASVKLTSPRARLFFSLLSSSGWGENRGNIEWAWFFDLCEGGFRNLKCSRINRCWSLIISREFEASNESRPTQRILESRLAIAHGTQLGWFFSAGNPTAIQNSIALGIWFGR